MPAETFAALFLAHVMADYLLQSSWLVANKRRPIALGIHIGMVFITLPIVTGMLSIWFVALAAMHLAIDILKTFFLPEGLSSYIGDQVLHVLSILVIVGLAPGLWQESPFASAEALPLAYGLAAGVIFAARGGQFAIEYILPRRAQASVRGPLLGVVERSLLAGSVLTGLLWLGLAVVGAKLVFAGATWRSAAELDRQRLLWGSTASLVWTLVTAVPLSVYLIAAL